VVAQVKFLRLEKHVAFQIQTFMKFVLLEKHVARRSQTSVLANHCKRISPIAELVNMLVLLARNVALVFAKP